jgi:hypothetical protein
MAEQVEFQAEIKQNVGPIDLIQKVTKMNNQQVIKELTW